MSKISSAVQPIEIGESDNLIKASNSVALFDSRHNAFMSGSSYVSGLLR